MAKRRGISAGSNPYSSGHGSYGRGSSGRRIGPELPERRSLRSIGLGSTPPATETKETITVYVIASNFLVGYGPQRRMFYRYLAGNEASQFRWVEKREDATLFDNKDAARKIMHRLQRWVPDDEFSNVARDKAQIVAVDIVVESGQFVVRCRISDGVYSYLNQGEHAAYAWRSSQATIFSSKQGAEFAVRQSYKQTEEAGRVLNPNPAIEIISLQLP